MIFCILPSLLTDNQIITEIQPRKGGKIMKIKKELNQFKVNALWRNIVNEIVRDSKKYDEGSSEKNIIARLEDIYCDGTSSGIVDRLIRYRDTTGFYNRFKKEINKLMAEMLEDKVSINELFGISWDYTDPFALKRYNQNLLVQTAYEEIVFQLRQYFREKLTLGIIKN